MLNVALLGAGLFATQAHLPAIKQLNAQITLKAIYSRSHESALKLAKAAEQSLSTSSLKVYHDAGGVESNLDALLASTDIHAVIVLLPITVQPGIILRALAAGKHVLSEKPVAPDVISGIKLIQTYDSDFKGKGLIWRVAENFECEPGLEKAGQAIKQGKIGKVSHWRFRMNAGIEPEGNQWYKTPWRTVPDYQGGFLLDGGVHFAATLRTVLVDSTLNELSGFASLTREYLPPHDTIHSVIRSTDGSHGTFDVTFALPPAQKGFFGMTVIGADGILTIDDEEKDGKSAFKVYINKGGKGEEVVAWEQKIGVLRELESFANKVSNGVEDGKGDPKGALQDVAIIEASLTSNGSPINLQQLLNKN